MPKPVVLEGSIAVTESIREKHDHEGFIAGLFQGETRFDYLDNFKPRDNSLEAKMFLTRLGEMLKFMVDPDEIDRTGEVPEAVMAGLAKIGAFGIKIPKEYGGLGLTQSEYHQVAALVGAWDGNVTALLSAHNSIGVPEPIKQFGTDGQKKEFWPRLAGGEISAFALTEKGAGCDIAQIKTYAVRVKENGVTKGYRITGEKLYTTNAMKSDTEFLAKLIVVIARVVDDPGEIEMSDEALKAQGKKKCYGGFIVDTALPGMAVIKKLSFMGLRAIFNGIIGLDNVDVPVANRLGQEGDGLKIALTTLTTGRLTLPAACLGGMKRVLKLARLWGAERVQWGKPVGEHEQLTQKIVRIAARTLALEAIIRLMGNLVDQHRDVRLESAAVKVLGSQWYWESVNDLMQIRGGRGYETAQSLETHSEHAMGVERMLRDARINLIFEGVNDLMLLWIAREGLDPYIKAGLVIAGRGTLGQKTSALAGFTRTAYKAIFPSNKNPQAMFLLGNAKLINRKAREISRAALVATLKYQDGLQRRQLPMAYLSQAALDLFAVSTALAYVSFPDNQKAFAIELAEWFAQETLQPDHQLGRQIFRANDRKIHKLGKQILKGELAWLEEGIL